MKIPEKLTYQDVIPENNKNQEINTTSSLDKQQAGKP